MEPEQHDQEINVPSQYPAAKEYAVPIAIVIAGFMFAVGYRKLLEQGGNGKLMMTRENAGYLLNLLWALGLANKNPILEDKTEMMNPSYGGAGNFASTGGWTIAKGDAMEHYNMHAL